MTLYQCEAPAAAPSGLVPGQEQGELCAQQRLGLLPAAPAPAAHCSGAQPQGPRGGRRGHSRGPQSLPDPHRLPLFIPVTLLLFLVRTWRLCRQSAPRPPRRGERELGRGGGRIARVTVVTPGSATRLHPPPTRPSSQQTSDSYP